MRESCDAVKIKNKDYLIIDEIDNFVYLSNLLDENDFLVRKTFLKDGKEFFQEIEDKDEYNKALTMFNEKNKDV